MERREQVTGSRSRSISRTLSAMGYTVPYYSTTSLAVHAVSAHFVHVHHDVRRKWAFYHAVLLHSATIRYPVSGSIETLLHAVRTTFSPHVRTSYRRRSLTPPRIPALDHYRLDSCQSPW